MRAVVFEDFQTFPSISEIERPRVGPGEVLLTVAGAGACHSDVAIFKEFAEGIPGSLEAYRRLDSGEWTGRAVVTPHST